MSTGPRGGRRFVMSDTQFGHDNTWAKFKNADGSPLRPFTSSEEMNETMVDNWNRVVNSNDTVYHLGDVVIAKRNLETVKRLNGRKILIMGNHDIFKNHEYVEAGFESLHSYKVFVDKWILSHVPLHPDCVGERFRANVHGHLHGNRIMQQSAKTFDKNDAWSEFGTVTKIDPRYFSVCVEQINYTPMSFDELEAAIQKQWDELGYAPKAKAWGNGSGPG